ncbi:glycosyltransferase family 2 protein [Magnetospirillum sulfuroxidans]|uniref:Glycosyltransferase family 2 protein n=1 Tax=Magnetospirillum sulfuroxidans TaxID=611300 RepID=A0ABS5IGZ8_9PROT|nr:glycosyltransferase family 2 protein [Magnetospirillum sulfuroxidans]MBR9973709.1 glycosyltransferase family 2 protein [Magnetospirillum sulfuroxidans]
MTHPHLRLSALVVVHNEEKRLQACLERLSFADEIVVVLDKCTDGSKAIAARFTDRLLEGRWDMEGERRNTGIAFCTGDWVLEVDADEHIPPELAVEIRATIDSTTFDWHEILVDNYIGERLVRHGWGGSFGKAAYPGLFRKEAKTWGNDRVHPSLIWRGRKGPMLKNRINHYVDRNISDMIRRLDNYSTAKARDLRDRGETWGSTASNVRRMASRFWKCYVSRRGYREGGYGFIIAVCAALYPMLSHLKARLEKE